jgi:ATP-dependent DNA helicase 2 subunit 1
VQPPELRRYYPKPERNKVCRYPKVYVTPEEVRQIKGAGEGGMTLLGFKPLSCLKQHHQVRNCSFLYPDERSLPGSATAFIALHTAMGPDTMAVCRLAANRAREPRLVALLPQDEAVNEDGWQAS